MVAPDSYSHILVEPLTGHIGAEISGVTLAEPLADPVVDEINRALLTHLVVFFRDQEITPAQHKAFAENFGDFHIHPLAGGGMGGSAGGVLGDHPEIIVLESDETTKINADRWHSDVTYDTHPPMGSILHAKILPESGGDTIWVNLYAAYEALSAHMQRLLDPLVAIHDGITESVVARYMSQSDGPQALATLREQIPPVEHPVVRTHSVTGKKSIFVNEVFTREIKGMNPPESRALLGFLYEHFHSPEFQVRFRWAENSIAFWDNRCTLHYAVYDHWPQRRRMQRVTIAGERPR